MTRIDFPKISFLLHLDSIFFKGFSFLKIGPADILKQNLGTARERNELTASEDTLQNLMTRVWDRIGS
jgi:hypothetical protein